MKCLSTQDTCQDMWRRSLRNIFVANPGPEVNLYKTFLMLYSAEREIYPAYKWYISGFQLDWNLLRTFCPSSPNFVRTFGNFLGHFFNTKFYHHKRKLPSALLKLKQVVVLQPFRMVSAVWLIVWLFISWGERSLSIVVSGSGWGTVFCGCCTTR